MSVKPFPVKSPQAKVLAVGAEALNPASGFVPAISNVPLLLRQN